MNLRTRPKNILDDSPYWFCWLDWVRGTPGVVILIIALAALAIFAGWHFFNLHTEAEKSDMTAKPVTQLTAQPKITQPVTPIAKQKKASSHQETVVPDHKEVARNTEKNSEKHYSSVEAKNENGATIEAVTQDDQEIVVKNDSSASATGEVPVTEPVVDYWSSVHGYTKAVDDQSKEIDEILKKLNGGN